MAAQLTDNERQEIRELIESGKSRNVIAKKVNRSGDTVSRIAIELGYVFGQSNKQNVEARKAYCEEQRQIIRTRLLSQANKMIDELDQPTIVFSFGGKENDYNEHELDKPDAKTKRDLLVSVAVCVDKAELIEKNSQVDDSGKGAMLALFEAIGVQVAKPSTDTPTQEVPDE